MDLNLAEFSQFSIDDDTMDEKKSYNEIPDGIVIYFYRQSLNTVNMVPKTC